MEKQEIKKKLIDDCYTNINSIIESLKLQMSDTQESANDYGQPKDRYDSYRMQLLSKRDMYVQQLDNAMAELSVLKRIDPNKISTEVGFGSVVITDDQKLFVAISMTKIHVGEDIYFPISIKVPFFQSIKGLKTGDMFSFSNKEHFIRDVF